jgi:hypothetical protein
MWDENLKWLHVHKTPQKKNENKFHHNVRNFGATSSTMKHDNFHLGFFLINFFFKIISHSTKSLHVWWFVIIHATKILIQHASNTINVNK